VSHDLSRKHFVAKGLGLLALAGLAPKLRAFSASAAAAQGRVSSSRTGSVQRTATAHSQAAPKLRVEPRAIARSDFAPSSSAPTSTAADVAPFRN